MLIMVWIIHTKFRINEKRIDFFILSIIIGQNGLSRIIFYVLVLKVSKLDGVGMTNIRVTELLIAYVIFIEFYVNKPTAFP